MGIKILFLSPEMAPYAKTGGLADVTAALPRALMDLGAELRVVLPAYRSVKQGSLPAAAVLRDLGVRLAGHDFKADIFETREAGGVPVLFIDREDLYDRPHLYGGPQGDYYDNLVRFSVYAHLALNTARALRFAPDLIHCHDWQAGLVAALLQGPHRMDPCFRDAACVFTIHNIGYQGLFQEAEFAWTGMSKARFFHPEGMEYWGKLSLLKAGILYSDAVTTVSPRHAEEIQTPRYGRGMEGILRRRQGVLKGILNGVDYRTWNPSTDVHLPARFSPGAMAGKRLCKLALLEETGLAAGLQSRPLVGMVSRFDAQKGFDLLLECLPDILALDVGLAVLGSGEERIAEGLRRAAGAHPERLVVVTGFDEPMAHRIIAGADIFLIPSRYEPCGLTQMYALKYGTVPVVSATGGLDDTIQTYDPRSGKGNGFKFREHEAAALVAAVRKAVELFADQKQWQTIVANAMKADFSWGRSARQYMKLFRSLRPKAHE